MNTIWQPSYLHNDTIMLVPLKETDFEELYSVASDPLIWEQHPNKLRYQRDVFQIGTLCPVTFHLTWSLCCVHCYTISCSLV